MRRDNTMSASVGAARSRRHGRKMLYVPEGQITQKPVQPLFQKYFYSRSTQINFRTLSVPPHRGAFRDRHGRGAGCGGRGGVGQVRDGRAGSPVSDQRRADERCCCGRRSRVVLTPRRRRQVCGGASARPGLDNPQSANDGDKKARSPGRARSKPLKPLRVGMPGEPGGPSVTTLVCLFHFCTRGCGCIGHPAFPTPSMGEKSCKPRALRAAGMRSCVFGWFETVTRVH